MNFLPNFKIKFAQVVRDSVYDEFKNIFKIMDSKYTHSLNWIDSQKSLLLNRVKQWVNINSYSWNIDGLEQMRSILQEAFNALGGNVACHELPMQTTLDSNGSLVSKPLGKVLVFRKRSQAPFQIFLGGHFDTVFSPSSSFQNIEMKNEDILIGPGVSDMKGGIAILLTTMEALERSPFAEQIGWEIILSPDEEIGSIGSAPLYEAAAQRHLCGLIFEPSFPDGAFVNERKGSATYTVLVRGKSAHVGRDFSHGRSAVFPIAHFIHQLEKLQQDPNLIVNVADLEGKGPVNIVPPLASCRVNLRSSDAMSLENAKTQLEQFTKDSGRKDIQFEIFQDSYRGPKAFDLKTKNLFKAYAGCADELNIPFTMRATGGVCDGNILAGGGLPTLDTAGAIGGALHTHDEYLIVHSLIERAKLAALFLFKTATKEIQLEKENFHG